MVRRSTWVVLGVFALVLALAWFMRYQKEQEAAKATPTSAPKMVFSAGAENPVVLRFTGSDGKVLEMQDKGVDGWQIVEPALGPADPEKISNVIGELLALRVSEELESLPAMDAMGLDKPAYTIQLTWSDLGTHVLEVGKATPISSGYYARIDGGQPMLIPYSGLTNTLAALKTPPVMPTATPAPETPEAATPTVQP